jgi:hypothetical protein
MVQVPIRGRFIRREGIIHFIWNIIKSKIDKVRQKNTTEMTS